MGTPVDRRKDAEATGMIKHYKEGDGLEAWRRVHSKCMFRTALSKSKELEGVQHVGKEQNVKKYNDAALTVAAFERRLTRVPHRFPA